MKLELLSFALTQQNNTTIQPRYEEYCNFTEFSVVPFEKNFHTRELGKITVFYAVFL